MTIQVVKIELVIVNPAISVSFSAEIEMCSGAAIRVFIITDVIIYVNEISDIVDIFTVFILHHVANIA